MSNQNPKSSIAEQIKERTGFILEHDVAAILESNGWGVIHNRFYLDDVQPVQREIDLLVYKVSDYEDLTIYTSIIVSCKKSTFKDWVFLTRDAHATKLNLDVNPFTYWSNSKKVNHMIKDVKFSDIKFCNQEKLNYLNSLFEYNKTVFAFREYDNKQAGNKLATDTAIYESIITLIKSQAFELESLPIRRKDKKCFYNINLLAVADVKEFIEIECSGQTLTEKKIDRINYVNRFLVNKREHNSRIIFTKFSAIEKAVQDFNLLHELNGEILKNGIKQFYSTEIFENYRARKIILDEYGDDLVSSIRWEIEDEVKVLEEDLKYLDFAYKSDEDILEIEFSASEALINYLNRHEKAIEKTKQWLKQHIRYDGDFVFLINDLPF